MPSVNSSSRPKVWPSSTFTTPSLPTFSIAFAITSPISRSRDEILATRAMSSLPETSFDCDFRFSTTTSTDPSMPRFSDIGFAPAATFFIPSRTIAWARTVAVVVPSPATSEVLDATSLHICAPMFSNLSFSSISFATETPSLVTVGAPNERSSTTLRPLGPSVTWTASARMFRPWTIRLRAPSWNLTSLAGIASLSLNLGSVTFDDAHDVFLAHDEELIALDLHGLPGVLAEQHAVADLEVERNQLALVILLSLAHGHDLALVGFLGGGVGDHDATRGLALLFDALDDHAVMQRTNLHAGSQKIKNAMNYNGLRCTHL